MSALKLIQPKAIVAEITMRDGTVKRLECEMVTRDKMTAIIKAGEKSVTGDTLYSQLAIIFGGKKEDYFDIDDVRTVKQIIDFVNEQIKNPE